jgi:hypothetical protein
MSISTLIYVGYPNSDYLDLHPNGQKHDFAIFHSLDFFGLVEEFENLNMTRADKLMRLLC